MFITEEERKFNENAFKLDFDEVISSLEKVKGTEKQKTALCPAHNDNSASLSVKRGEDNKAIIFCHSRCQYEDIVRAMGLWKEAPVRAERITSRIVDTYDYTSEDGQLLYQVVRLEPKSFRQRRPDGKGNFIYNLDGITRVLYNLPELLKESGEPVFIVEGEKDCNNLLKIGAIATTNSGGGAKWEKSFNKYFAGKDVIILPDNDIVGREHAEIVSKHVYRSAKSVKIVNLPVDNKEDVSDYIAEGNGLDELLYLCREIAPLFYTEEDLTTDPSQSHSLEAENAVLGAIFKNPILISRVLEAKLDKHFFDKRTRQVLKAITECFSNGDDINYVTVGNNLGKLELEHLGGYDYLKSLEKDLPDVFNIDSWVKIIISKSQYRDLVNIGKKLSSLAEHEAASVEKLTDSFMGKVYDIQSEEKRKGLSKLSLKLEDVIINAREAVGKQITGLSTGLSDLDYITSGLQKTDLIIIAGRPSMGKTSLAVNIATNVGKLGAKVGIFSLEMSEEQLIAKIVCSEAYVNSFDFKNGTMQESDWEKIANVLPDVDALGVFIDDTPGITFPELRSKALRMKEEEDLDLIVIDYLQLMTGNSSFGANRQQEISDISRALKGLAKELGIPVVALSQLSRASELRTDKRPMLSDLRESGAIEQDADIVMFAYRPEYYNPDDSSLAALAEIIIAKQRQGPTGTVELAFLKEYTKFVNLYESAY